MQMRILNAGMTHTKEDGYLAKVEFEVEGHPKPYEVTLHSKNNREYSYALFFSHESGDEEQILAVEEWLEEDDDAFDRLVQAARDVLAAGNR